MHNIVKSVVFAAVVLFAGVAAFQVIHKGEVQQEAKPAADFHTQTVLDMAEPREVVNVCAEMMNEAYEAYSHCSYQAIADGQSSKLSDCKAVFASFKRGHESICSTE